MAKAKKKTARARPPKRTKASKRLAKYQNKLAQLREYVSGFDGKAWEQLYERKPRTKAGEDKKRKELAAFNARHRQLKPFITRSAKRVAPKSAAKVEALREYAGMPKVKGLRAVPVEVVSPKARVKVDRKNRVTVKHGRVTEVMYKFPKRPRNHRDSAGRYLTAGEHAIEMLRAMLKKLPKNGQFVIVTSHHSMIPWSGDHGSIVKTLVDFVYQYEGKGVAPWLMPKIQGVKRVGTSMQGLWDYKAQLKDSRSKARKERVEAKRAQHEKAAHKLGKISKRARATGRQ